MPIINVKAGAPGLSHLETGDTMVILPSAPLVYP